MAASDGPARGADHEDVGVQRREIAYAARQVEADTVPADARRHLGISEATFCVWKNTYAHVGVGDLLPPPPPPRPVHWLQSLEDKDGRLKRLVAGLRLDKDSLTEALRQTVSGPSIGAS